MVSYAQQAELDNEELSGVVKLEDNQALPSSVKDLLGLLDEGNIADQFADKGNEVMDLYDVACQSMAPWKRKYDKALRLCKLQPKEKKKTFPFEGASTAMAPFVQEACIDFNARSAPELAYSDNIVKAKILGNTPLEDKDIPKPPQEVLNDPMLGQPAAQAYNNLEKQKANQIKEKEDRGERVTEYCNYQLRHLIPNWVVNQDKLLFSLPCVGTMYRVTYFDSSIQEVRSDLCYGDEIKFDMAYPTFDEAPDKHKHLPPMTRNEVIEKIRGDEQWLIGESELSDDDKETYDFVKSWTWCDLDGDGLKEPYCVVTWKQNNKIVYARPYYDEDSITYNDDDEIIKVDHVDSITQYQFMPDVEGGPMGMGWGILLGPMFEEINTHIRQLTDAGTLQVLASNSGLIAADTTTGRGNSVQRGPVEMALGKLTPISVRGGSNLAQNVVQFPAAGPSPALFELMQYMVDTARRLTDASSQVDANPNEAAALYLARLQQSLKRPNILIMRVYYWAAQEFQKIRLLNYKHFDDEKYNRIIDSEIPASMEMDFNPEDCDIELVADPSQGSDIERIARAETILQQAKEDASGILNKHEAYTRYFEALGVADVESLIPPPSNEMDPMQKALIQRDMMDAEFRERDQQLREREQNLKAMQLELEQQKQALQAAKEAAEMGIDMEQKIADITDTYTDILKKLVEMGSTDPIADAVTIEDTFQS